MGNEVFGSRSGWLLRLKDEAGNIGWGEAAPLPGFSRETPAQAVDDLERICTEINDRDPLESGRIGSIAGTPSTTFAVELAVANLEACRVGLPVARVFNPDARPSQSINAILLAEEPVSQVQRAIDAGFRAVKMKVGRGSVDDDARRVREASVAIEGRATLRLDANRAWPVRQAEAFADLISGVDLEYVEEPLADAAGLPGLVRRTGLPVAIDESVVDLWPDGPDDWSWLVAVVLKPTILGGILKVQDLAARAKAEGVGVVISSSIETSVGLFGLAALASSLGQSDSPAGLDTLRLLSADVAIPAFPSGVATVSVAQPASYRIVGLT